ncbi:MurR/RpiR family transcriptional regulator [Ostreiculturibacter nitratireducens]|uniref:MurR/RpiR family transcriptional regulator n=1 Tax=Ostreiculturibacter nitratireducens TaxID=3075226 RepID=UPI0031B5EA64
MVANPPVAAPDTIDAFEARLVEVTPSLPKRLRQCADYIAANTDRIAVSTVAELAAGAGVPPSALMRFCQIIGFSGFSEMQRLFRDNYAQGRPDYATRLRNLREMGGGSASALLAEFVEAGRQSLEALAREVDEAALNIAIGHLAKAGLIHVAGFRRAYPVASYLAYAFEKMDIPAMLHDGTGKLDHSHALRDGDALIAITFAPYSSETVALVEGAAARGVPVVAITDTAISPIAGSAAALLTVPEVDFGAFRSLSATLALAISLAVAVGTARSGDTARG